MCIKNCRKRWSSDKAIANIKRCSFFCLTWYVVMFVFCRFMKSGRGWTAAEPSGSVRTEATSFLSKFVPSKAADVGGQGFRAQPMVWRPPSSLLAPQPWLSERPVSAPPYRGEPPPVAPSWDNYEHDSGQLQVRRLITRSSI